MWYHKNVGKNKLPIVDTWWQTETGGILITPLPGAMTLKPGSANRPFFGVVPKVFKDDGTPAGTNEGGKLVIEKPWPGMLRGTYGDAENKRIKEVYFSTYPGVYFTGDGARVDEDGDFWLMGRVDDVINVSGPPARHGRGRVRAGLSHEAVAEAAVVGYPHDIKGEGIYVYVTLKEGVEPTDDLKKILIGHVRTVIGPIATPDKLQFAPGPAEDPVRQDHAPHPAEDRPQRDRHNLGDTSTLPTRRWSTRWSRASNSALPPHRGERVGREWRRERATLPRPPPLEGRGFNAEELMVTALVIVFIVAYAAIALEHPLKVNKSASALIGAGLLWTLFALATGAHHLVGEQLRDSLATTAGIVFFLMGAMTIVEVVDAHNGFEVITCRIRTTSLSSLMWLVGFVTFFLSSVLDNLTTTIVMISLMKKLLDKHDDRLFFAGMIVIAANAGGAWSPIGDVTTTMLWIGGQITTLAIMKSVFLASVVNLVVPLAITSYLLRGTEVVPPAGDRGVTPHTCTDFERNLMFFMGIGILIAVPVFKTVTHLPPFMGILFGLGILWLTGELVHRGKEDDEKEHLTLARALVRIDMSSIVFFIGILLAVATLEHSHILSALATTLDQTVGRQDVIVLIIGIASAIVDNVPLVAASMGMYELAKFPADSFLWEFIAYCAGTGGSILIIGSAAGVAAMGLEKIHFFWYVKRISGLALVGYFAGAAVYVAQYRLLH